jgi:anaerobic magnesium-protoporphyrin IX monomethyl ester cyclase
MRVLLVYPAPPSADWPRGIFRSQWVPTGIACIGGLLRRGGHAVKVFVTEEQLVRNGLDWAATRAALQNLLREFRPDMVGLSLVTPGVAEGRWIAQQAKEICGSRTLVAAGGPHATALPEELLTAAPEIDLAVVGEGELTMVDLATGGPGPSVNGVVFRDNGQVVRTPPRPPVQDLDSIGPPDYDLFNMDYYVAPGRWMIHWLPLSATNIRTARGCTNRCQFCGGHLVSGVGVRFHSLGYVIEQMKEVRRRFNVEAVHFEDDTMGADRARLLELCERIRSADLHRQLKWDACLRVDQADAELLGQMKSAGCIQIEYGFESGSTDALRRLGKQTTADMNRRAVALTRQTGLRIFADIMLGLPGETRQDLDQTIKFLRWARPEVIIAGRLVPLPGTALYQSLDERVRQELDWGGYAYFQKPGRPVNFTAMEDARFDKAFREFLKYTVRPQTRWSFLRDTPAGDRAVRRDLWWKLASFAIRHPLRALRVPW